MCNICFIILAGEIIGYVHNVTAVQKSGKMNYTTCELQTTDKSTTKAICFSPEKTKPLRRAMENKIPVKLTKYEYNERYRNIVIKNTTSVTEVSHPVDFARAESLSTTVSTISNIKTTSPHELVSLKATVKHLSGTKVINMDKGSLKKCSCILQDTTGTIEAVFWEEWVGIVENEKTYMFTNFRVKKNNYTNEVYVNTAKDGFEVKECDPFEQLLPDVQPSIADIATKQATVSIIGVKNLTKYNTCSACGKKMEGSGKTVKCESCKLKQRISPEGTSWYARLYLQNRDTKEKFYLTAFNQELIKLLEENDEDLIPEQDEETITDFLLDIDNVEIRYNIADGKLIEVVSNLDI
jgi:hypothetical protein